MSKNYLDPEILGRIDNYSLLARTVVEGFVAGLHRSLYHGFGAEFVQYRDYARGDDLKYIDWKVLARHDRLHIKVFREETNANGYVIVDCSASMAYAGEKKGGLSKLHYAKMIAASLSYLMAQQGDNVGLYAYSDQVQAAIRPGNRSAQVQDICLALARLEARGKGGNIRLLEHLAERFTRRGLIVVISDFLDADADFFRLIQQFRSAHHDCLLLQVLHDDELDFSFTGSVRFIDSETGEERLTSPEAVRRQYLERMQAFLATFDQFCLESAIDPVRIRTSDSLAAALSAFLHQREGRRSQ